MLPKTQHITVKPDCTCREVIVEGVHSIRLDPFCPVCHGHPSVEDAEYAKVDREAIEGEGLAEID